MVLIPLFIEPNTQPMKYSKRAVHFCVISLVVASLFLILSQIERDPSWNIDVFTGYLITFQYMSILIGFAVSIMALSEKERKKTQTTAIAINIVLFTLLAIFFLWRYLS